MDTRRITVVTAGLSRPSSTRMLADRLADATASALAERGLRSEVTVVELRDLAHDVTDNLLTGFAGPALQTAIDAVTGADALIAVSPVFTTSYSGLFKSFVDVLDTTALTGLPVLLGATGGSPRHSLALDYAMRPLFTYLHAEPLSTAVFAATDDWGGTTDDARALPGRIERAGAALAEATARRERRTTAPDPWSIEGSFADLLGRPGSPSA